MEDQIVSNSLNHIKNNTCLFQDLISIHIPQYLSDTPTPHFLHGSGRPNPKYVFPTPLVNIGVMGSSHNYAFEIPPWLQGPN